MAPIITNPTIAKALETYAEVATDVYDLREEFGQVVKRRTLTPKGFDASWTANDVDTLTDGMRAKRLLLLSKRPKPTAPEPIPASSAIQTLFQLLSFESNETVEALIDLVRSVR